MLLESKNVLVFAATGAIAGKVARVFSNEGAHVYVSGRNISALNELVQSIEAAGGKATAHMVDALDEGSIESYVAQVREEAGSIDAVFNGIGGRPSDLGYPAKATTTPVSDFMLPLQRILTSQFLTSRIVGSHMIEQGSGSIVLLSATLSGMTAAHMTGITATCAAIEGMTRSLAGEFGPAGVRVNCARGSAMPETRTIQETFAGQIALAGGQPPAMTLPPLGRPISVEETANTAAFLASNHASGITGQVITVCAGAFVG